MAVTINGTDGITFNDGSEQWAAASPIGMKNLIINGDMRIAQRGTSTSGITSGNYYTLDRFYTNNASVGSFTQSQDTDVPSGQGFSNSLKLSCDTSDTPVTSEWTSVQCRLEAQMLSHLKYGTASAETTTLSFWVKSNKTGTYTLAIYKDDTTAQGISKTYTIDTADTWEKKTITIEGHTSNSIANDNSIGLRLYWVVATGPDRQSSPLQTSWGAYDSSAFVSSSQVNLADSTSNYINITGVQLEVGDTATPFEHTPLDFQWQRCNRYFVKVGHQGAQDYIGGGFYNDTTNIYFVIHTVPMRTAPTISYSALSDFDLEPFDVPPTVFALNNSSYPYERHGIRTADSAARTRGFFAMVACDVANGYMYLDAEL